MTYEALELTHQHEHFSMPCDSHIANYHPQARKGAATITVAVKMLKTDAPLEADMALKMEAALLAQ
jgi:hypothetical protein